MATPFFEIIKQAENYIAQKEYQKALDLYDLCLTTNPDDPHLRYCIASLYSELYKSGIAISMLRNVVKDVPQHAQAWNNLGIAYKNVGQWNNAYDAYMRALELNYDPMTLVNLSGLFINNATPEDALKWSNKGLKLAPATPQLKNHRALALLEMGNFKEGFPAYDARFGLPGWSSRNYAGPLWKGEYVERLLIHGEQGLGDEICFMQTIDRVRKRVGSIVMECAKPLVPVFKHSFPDVECYGHQQELAAAKVQYNAWVPMGSLFGIVGYEEHREPFLKVSKPYPKGDKFRIGVSWRGGTVATHEHLRNFELDKWLPLLNNKENIDWISVQYGPAAGMAERLGLPHDQPAIQDFERLTGLIASCDLVISVANTTVHQCGGLGVTCWALVPSKPSWQFGLKGEHMPWYGKHVRMFRQGDGEDWSNVIDRVRSELANLGVLQGPEQAVA